MKGCCTRMARTARTMWTDEAPLLGGRWACGNRKTAVLKTLGRVFAWISTVWWRKHQSNEHESGPWQSRKVEAQVRGGTIEDACGTKCFGMVR